MGERAAWGKMTAMCGRSTSLGGNADETSSFYIYLWSDLPLNVIVESANSQANVVLQMTPPVFGQTGNRPRSLSLTLMLNPFLTFSVQQLDSLFESRRTNEYTLTTKHLGLPRPNVSIQQVSTYTIVTFHRFYSVNVRSLH